MDNGRKRHRVLRVNQSPWVSGSLLAPLNLQPCAVDRQLGLIGKSTPGESSQSAAVVGY